MRHYAHHLFDETPPGISHLLPALDPQSHLNHLGLIAVNGHTRPGKHRLERTQLPVVVGVIVAGGRL